MFVDRDNPDDLHRIRMMVAEMRAQQLVRALRRALNNSPHWRFEARGLLNDIDQGIPPFGGTGIPRTDQAA